MKTRPKQRGTRNESRIVGRALEKGFLSERYAEGGVNDRGDLWIETRPDLHPPRLVRPIVVDVEAKERERLNVHEALGKAIEKSGNPRTVVFWKRLGTKPGNQKRSQVGPPLVAMTEDFFFYLLDQVVG